MSWRHAGLVALVIGTAGCRQILGLHDLPQGPTADAPPIVEIDGSCADQCTDSATLSQCDQFGNAMPVTCTWGCLTVPDAHCGKLVPSGGGATSSDLDPDSALGAVTLQGATIDGDTGMITNGPVVTGFLYSLENGIAVFRFASLTINGPIALRGTHPIALVSVGDITVDSGTNLDAQGSCNDVIAVAGGYDGGQSGLPGLGMGGGMPGTGGSGNDSGGSGGGNGTIGGMGGAGATKPATAGGVATADAKITTLMGGAGGGGGSGPKGNSGGAGGGALQLVANGMITFAGRLDAGGCGGTHGGADSSGAGGGAGGTVLLEARTIQIASNAQITVNGGGGGGAGGLSGGNDGANGGFQQTADGGNGYTTGDGRGGDGGGGVSVVGGDGGNSNIASGGGGGGAAGRIRINTLTGTATIDANALLSPGLAEDATTTTEGTIDIE